MANQNKQNGGHSGGGNFANDRERASEAGRKGGQSNQQGQSSGSESGNFAGDPERAREAGRKGGQSSHSGGRGGNR